ncbi:hypothetical protein [Methylocystis sp.]|uniref:hypothetical protein n=1 Tax=Methylocystis sp. TaxID=1911079 RepID=UPI003D0BAC5B
MSNRGNLTNKQNGWAPVTLDCDPANAFDRFLAAFPQRPEGHDAEAARDAWRGAIARADAETIIAGAVAYARTTEGRPARYVMSAQRWLREARWRKFPRQDTNVASSLIWIAYGSHAWRAWAAFYTQTKGKTPPIDRRGGWRFPAQFPPAMDAAEYEERRP